MPASTNLDSGTPGRSSRLKKIHIIYDEDSDRDSSSFKRVKTELIDSEEIASPSISDFSVASVSDKDSEQDCHDVSLKVIKAQCKAKNQKTSKTTLEGCDIKNQITTEEEFDLDKPLIALKQKKPKRSPGKANRKMEALTSSPCAVEVEDTTSKRYHTLSPIQSSPFKATTDEPTLEKLGRRVNDLEQSKIVIHCIEEIVGEQICCAEVKNTAGALASCEKTDVLCEIKIEHIDCSEGFGTSSCSVRNSECLSFELQQELMEDDECIPQACFTNKPNQLGDGSDHSCEQTCAVKENSFDDITEKTTQIASLSGIIDEVSNRQKTSENISNSDVDKSSTGNGILASLSQSCHDRIDNDEYWNTGVAHGNEPESVKILEELSPIDESSTDMVSLPKMVESDLCGSTEMNCTSLEEVVQMQGEYQLDSVVCLGVRPKHMLLDAEIEHTVSDYTFSLDKTLDLTQPVNFVTQDGRLESIVYDVLNNHAQRMTSENRSSVGLPDTAVIQSTVVNFNSNSSEDKSTSDSKISFAPNSFVTSLESDGQIKKSELFIDEESIEEHGPKKLLSKRKIMSPTSQEKLCNALTGIDLCDGVQRLKRKIVTEDCDKTRISLPQPALKQYQSMFSTDRKLKGRTDTSPTSKGILKSTGFPPHQQTTCSCMRNSSVVLDTEKAVEFSQRQMHDVENIAAKLIRSLKHMRSIVDESLSSEAYSLLPNFNIAEIRAASEDALEVEKTTRKWLSIMNKDCNRFCKILSLAKKNVVSHPEMPRKQRKIIFADETGGTLCHVKVFKDGQTSLLSECQSDL